MQTIPTYESLTTEFESQWGDDGRTVRETVVAFANTFGGDLFIGINDDGSVCGVDDIHRTEERLWNTVRDNIFPSLNGYIEAKRIRVDGKTVLHVHVARGPIPPYSLEVDNPSQVYVRVGSTSIPAKLEDIVRIVENRNPVPYEERTSRFQDLTFEKCLEVCRQRDLKFDPRENTNFGFWNPTSKLWTNLAYLYSDQCQRQMIMVNFLDDNKTKVGEIEKVQGNVFVLMERAIQFVSRLNSLLMEKPVDGSLARIDHYRVNPEAVRDVIINLIVHCDYSKDVPIKLQVTPSRLEFWTFGGFDDLLPVSVLLEIGAGCRNKLMAEFLMRLDILDSGEANFQRIKKIYSGIPVERLIQITANSIMISLPRASETQLTRLNERENRVLESVIARGSITRKGIEKLLDVSQPSAVLIANAMIKKGALVKEGAGPRVRYVIAPEKTNLLVAAQRK